MAARMISLLRFNGRRVAALVCLGAACLMLIMSTLFSVMVSLVLRGRLASPRRATVSLPTVLTLWSRRPPVYPTEVRRPSHSRVLVPDTTAHHPRTSDDGPHTVMSSASYNHETKDTATAQEGTGTPAHTHQSEPNGPPSTAGRPRWAGTKP